MPIRTPAGRDISRHAPAGASTLRNPIHPLARRLLSQTCVLQHLKTKQNNYFHATDTCQLSKRGCCNSNTCRGVLGRDEMEAKPHVQTFLQFYFLNAQFSQRCKTQMQPTYLGSLLPAQGAQAPVEGYQGPVQCPHCYPTAGTCRGSHIQGLQLRLTDQIT